MNRQNKNNFSYVLEQMLQVKRQIVDIGINRDFVLPFEISPHLTEFSVSARSRHDIVHNVNVNIVKDNDVTIGSRTGHIINNIAENNAVFRRSNLLKIAYFKIIQ